MVSDTRTSPLVFKLKAVGWTQALQREVQALSVGSHNLFPILHLVWFQFSLRYLSLQKLSWGAFLCILQTYCESSVWSTHWCSSRLALKDPPNPRHSKPILFTLRVLSNKKGKNKKENIWILFKSKFKNTHEKSSIGLLDIQKPLCSFSNMKWKTRIIIQFIIITSLPTSKSLILSICGIKSNW